jgi:hypothetical protein
MTNNIYPPDHLLRKWESLIIDEEQNVDVVLYEAFQAGADQELEACCEWVGSISGKYGPRLRIARRPKPPSLKAQALEALDEDHADMRIQNYKLIRSVLESLPD